MVFTLSIVARSMIGPPKNLPAAPAPGFPAAVFDPRPSTIG
jgi:hypothetical protein